MSWNPLETPVDFALFAGEQTPGLCKIEGDAALKRRWEEKKGHGFDGSGLVYAAKDLCTFQCIIRLTTVDDWNAWHTFKPRLFAEPTESDQKAIDFYHPQTAEVGIHAVVVEEIGIPKPVGDDGEWQIPIKLREYRKPKPKPPVRASGSKAEPKEEPEDEGDREVRKLSSQANGLETILDEGQ